MKKSIGEDGRFKAEGYRLKTEGKAGKEVKGKRQKKAKGRSISFV